MRRSSVIAACVTALAVQAISSAPAAADVLLPVFMCESDSKGQPARCYDARAEGERYTAIVNGRVVVGDNLPPFPKATVLIRDGKIVAVGAAVKVPDFANVVDASGKWVTPGIVAAITDLGLLDVDGVGESNDWTKGGGPFSAALDAATAINPSAQPIAVSRAGGVTRAAVVPAASGSIFAGQGAVIDLGADSNPLTRARAFQYIELGENGAQQTGGSRLTAHALLRNALREASDLARRGGDPLRSRSRAEPLETGDDLPVEQPSVARNDDVLLTRFDAAALIPVVAGRQPLYVHVDRAADIRAALGLKRECPALRLVIVGANEGWLAAAELVAAGCR